MEASNTVCPVCTLYLRPGITLKSHLASHPKQMVIEALVRLAVEDPQKEVATADAPVSALPGTSSWEPEQQQQQQQQNHSFIYQQFVSSTNPPNNVLNVNHLGQQYVTIPTVFNPQMMCQPYVYQQQQVIMSSSSSSAPAQRLLSIEDVEQTPEEPEMVLVEDSDFKQQIDYEEVGSPLSSTSSDYIRVRKDLNKSCQTTDEQKDFYSENEEEDSPSYVTLTSTTPVVEEMVGGGEQPAVGLIDMDGMNLMLSSQVVEDFGYARSYERPRILMSVGEYSGRELGDESVSVDGANIRADEHMPPRGELSGQESNASDMEWSKVQYTEPQIASVSYSDLIARETWDGSDASDNEIPPLQSRDPACCDDTPTVSGYLEPPIQYKCPSCEEHFTCLKERRAHQAEKHTLEVGSKIGKKKVKKIIIKPKKVDVKSENNFDNVFKLKLECEAERSTVILEPPVLEVKKIEEPAISNPVVCTSCNTVVADNSALKQHLEEVHNFRSEDRYKCGVCLETFKCEPKYTEHLHIHPLECRLCGKYFYRRQNMQLHMKRHLGIRPYKCTICEKAFLTKQKLDEHRNIHTGEAPIKCTMCEETFKRHSNLVQHRNRHHYNLKRKTKDYICMCGEIFHSKKKLAWHKEIHSNKPKACTQCTEKFVHAASLTRHMRRAHNERFVPKLSRDIENVECPVCNGVYLRTSLEVHMKTHSGQRPFTCQICSKDFTTKWNLKLHKWTHAARNNKPFKCDQCKGAFIRESDYVAHMNSHKSIKPYTCNYCGAQFIRKYNCLRHVREHEKLKTYECQVCGKTFHRSYYLNDHMRVHSGLRPYSCHICGKTSATKSNHNKHVRIHHAREPVSTEN